MATTSDILGIVVRLLADILAVTAWVAVMTLTFLATGWPRPAFYTLLIGGILAWVTVTADRKG